MEFKNKAVDTHILYYIIIIKKFVKLDIHEIYNKE